MNIIDTNTINYILSNNLKLKFKYFITPDIKGESEITEFVVGRKMPSNISEVINDGNFNPILYLKNYQVALNSHSGKSFYNMSGFGDISILALIKTQFGLSANSGQAQLPGMEETIRIYTEDNGLIKRINKEFNQQVKDGIVQLCDYGKIQ